MKNIKKALISMIAIVGLTTNVAAFEGFSVGAVYSMNDYSTSAVETTGAAGGAGVINSTSTSKSGSADIGSVFAEYTFAQGSTIGVDYIDGSAEVVKASRTSNSPAGTVQASADISDPITFYVEPTFMMNEKFGVYVKGGVTQMTITPKETDVANVTTSTYTAKDLNGVLTGFGAKLYLGESFFVKAEYQEVDYATYEHRSTTGELNSISANLDTEETRFALGYNF